MTITFEQAPALVEGILDGFLKPRPGAALPTHYVAKRGRGGRGGALCAVRRDCLTIAEREGHVRCLRRKGEHAEADALESETLAFIEIGALERR